MKKEKKLTVGEWVEVRSKEEILRTLDYKGQLDGMPFMSEMFQFCGKRFQVYKRAHKTCDPDYRSRRIHRAVHLETRCDGQAHGGCQAGCLLFWKEAWLKPVAQNHPHDAIVVIDPLSEDKGNESTSRCTESSIWNGAQAQTADAPSGDPTYICQATQVQYEEP